MKYLVLFITILFGPTTAQAKCPEIAFQNLYFLEKRIQNGQETNIKRINGYANLAMKQCSDHAPTMAITAELFFIIANNINGDMLKFKTYSKSLQAIAYNDAHHDKAAPLPTIKFENGTQEEIDTFKLANDVLTEVIPRLANFHLDGDYGEFMATHPVGNKCPYNSETRLMTELVALRRWTGDYNKKILVVSPRLSSLWITCPDLQNVTSYIRSLMSNDQASHYAYKKIWSLALNHAEESLFFKTSFINSNGYKPPSLKAEDLPKNLEANIKTYRANFEKKIKGN